MYPVQAGSAFSSSTTRLDLRLARVGGQIAPDTGAMPTSAQSVLAVHVRLAARIVADQDRTAPGTMPRLARTATRSAIALRISAAAALPSRI